MRELLVENPASMGLLTFFILGIAYYMAATILMRGSIFAGLRNWIQMRAEEYDSRFFGFLRSMLGCLMCTATELAFWTLAPMVIFAGLYYNAAGSILGALLQAFGAISASQQIELSWYMSLVVMIAVATALSFSVAGEAWLIKTVLEHREAKFLELREEFRKREEDLLERLVSLRNGLPEGSPSSAIYFSEIMIPSEKLEEILLSLGRRTNCKDKWCPFSRTTCYVRETNNAIQQWLIDSHRDERGADVYDSIFKNSIRTENPFYWLFWAEKRRYDSRMIHSQLEKAVRAALEPTPT